MRKPKTVYEHGRSENIVKIKVRKREGEGRGEEREREREERKERDIRDVSILC